MSEKISITGISGRGKHGVFPSEKSEEQEFVVDVTLKAKLLKAAESDDLAETIDYAEVAKLAHRVITGPSVNLIERLAKEIGEVILKNFPKVGVIGSGQLAQMTIASATALGIDFISLANSKDDSAAQISSHVVGDYTNLESVREFTKICDVVTFEHELIPLSIVKTLESEGVKFLPTSKAFQYSQNKALMREKLRHLPHPKWQIISEAVDWNYPAIAKSISGGYDVKSACPLRLGRCIVTGKQIGRAHV